MNVQQFKEIFSPWFDVVIKGFQDAFLNDYDINILSFLHENIDREIKFALSSTEKTQSLKRTKALYNVLTHLYEHILWKLRKEDFPNATLTCVILLSQLIRTGLILTQGLSKCEYIDRILMALNLFTGKQALLFDALLLVNGLKKIHRKPYSVILRCILTTDYKEVRDPLFYMEIILLFRRLRTLSDSKNEDLCFVTAKIKPPSNLISWLASLNVHGSTSFIKLLQHKKIALQLMKKNIPNTLLKRIRDLILGSYFFEENSNKYRHSKTSEPLSELFITDTSPMQMQGDVEVVAADLSNLYSVKKDRTKKQKTKKKKKTKPSKNVSLLNSKTERTTSIEPGNSVLYVNSFSNLVVSNEPCSSLHESDYSDTYIIPESKNEISEPVCVSTEEHRKVNKRKSKSLHLQVISQSQNERPNNSFIDEVTISDSDSLVEMPPKKSKRNFVNKNISPKRALSEEDNDKIQKAKKIKSISCRVFSDEYDRNSKMLQSGSEICNSARKVKKSFKQKRHSSAVDNDEISIVAEINKSEATNVSYKMESKEEKDDANLVSCPKNAEENLARHDFSDHIPGKNNTSNQNLSAENNIPSVQLSTLSKFPNSSKNYVRYFDVDSTVADDSVPQKSTESFTDSSYNNTHIPPNGVTESSSESTVSKSIHNCNEKEVIKVASLSENSADHPEVTKVLHSKSEVPQKYRVTEKSVLLTEVKDQNDISLDLNSQENENLENCLVKNVDIGSKTMQVVEEIVEIAHNYSSASKIPKETNLSHQNTNDISVPSTSLEGINKSDYHDFNSSTVRDQNTEDETAVQPNVPHDKISSSNEASEVDSSSNLELHQSLNEKTDKISVSSVDLSNNSDFGNVSVEGIDQEQYPSCSESGTVYSVVPDSKENFDQKDLAQGSNACELDAKNNIFKKNIKLDVSGSKLDLSLDNHLPETKEYGDISEEIKETINNESVNNKNADTELKTSNEDFESVHTSLSEIETTDKTAETINVENYSNSLQRKGDESSENFISQTSKNISSTLCVPEIYADSSEVSDSKTKNYVNLPVKNILGELLNIVISNETSRTKVGESDGVTSKTLCDARHNFTQISNKNDDETSKSKEFLIHEEKSAILLNNPQNDAESCNISANKAMENALKEEVTMLTRHNSQYTDKMYSVACDTDSEGTLEKKTESQNDEKAECITQRDACKISENIFEEGAILTDSENKTELKRDLHIDPKKCLISGDTVTKNVFPSILDPTPSQNDLNAKNIPVNESRTCDISDNISQEKPMDNVVQKTFSSCTDDFRKDNLKLEKDSYIDPEKHHTSGDTVSKNMMPSISELAPSLNDLNAENINESKTCDISVKTSQEKAVDNVVQKTFSSCTGDFKKENMKLEKDSQIDPKNGDISGDTVSKNMTFSISEPTPSLNDLNVENVNESETCDISVITSQEMSIDNAVQKTFSSCTDGFKKDNLKLEKDSQIDPKIRDISGDTVSKTMTPSISEPTPCLNELNAEHVNESKTCGISVNTNQEKAVDNVVQKTFSSDDLEKDNVKLEKDSQINPEIHHISGDTVIKNLTPSISEPIPSLNNLNAENVNESKTCNIFVNTNQEKAVDNVVQKTFSSDDLEKDNVKLEIDSQIDPKIHHISGDAVTKNMTPSISEPTSSLNDRNAENVNESKTCNISVNTAQEKDLANSVQLTFSSVKVEDEHNLSKLTPHTLAKEIDVKTVSNDTQHERACSSTPNVELSLSVPKFENSKEFTKETKLIFNESSHHSFASSPFKNASKIMHSEYVPYFCKNKDYVSFSDISLRNKGRQIVADSCLQSPVAITNFPSAATAEIFCEYRNGIICSTKDVLPQEDLNSKQPKSPSVSSIASDASKSPCVSSIASDEEIEIQQYSSAEEDLLVSDREIISQKESVQILSDTADPSISPDTNEDCNSSKIQSDSKKDSSSSENIKSLEPNYDSSSSFNHNEPDIPDKDLSEKVCPRQSLRLKNKTDYYNKTDFAKDAESEVSVPEASPKSDVNVPHDFALKNCSVVCDNLPIKSPSSTNSVLRSPQSSESCSSSQKSVSKKIPSSQVKLKQNKFISPKKPYALRHRKSKQTCDNSSNLDIDLSKLQLDSPSCRKITRSRTAKDAKFAKLLASKIDALKNDDDNELNVPNKRETRSSAAKTEQDTVQNTPGYNLRNRKPIIAPSKLNL